MKVSLFTGRGRPFPPPGCLLGHFHVHVHLHRHQLATNNNIFSSSIHKSITSGRSSSVNTRRLSCYERRRQARTSTASAASLRALRKETESSPSSSEADAVGGAALEQVEVGVRAEDSVEESSGVGVSDEERERETELERESESIWKELVSESKIVGREESEALERDQRYPLWFALPLQPGERRVTKRYEVVENQVYSFEQCIGTLDVIVNIRMTVVVLSGGGLFVHAPVAPTEECLRLMRELEEIHGEVKCIVLPTTAVEHKINLGPFARKYPKADVYVAPRQWSFPLNLPLALLGLGFRKAEIIQEDGDYPWTRDFDYTTLDLTVGIGPFVEVAFYHKKTRSLLVTDTVFNIPEEAPEVCLVDPMPLLKRSRDDKRDAIVDTKENRTRGWWKTTLFAIFFQPSSVEFDITGYPVTLNWRNEEWVEKVKSVQNRLLVAPILQVLVYSRDPLGALDYLQRIGRWNFQRIIPAHFSIVENTGPQDLRRAAKFLMEDSAVKNKRRKDLKGLPDLTPLLDWFQDRAAEFMAKNSKDGDASSAAAAQQQPKEDYPESELQLLRELTNFLTVTGIAGKAPEPDE